MFSLKTKRLVSKSFLISTRRLFERIFRSSTNRTQKSVIHFALEDAGKGGLDFLQVAVLLGLLEDPGEVAVDFRRVAEFGNEFVVWFYSGHYGNLAENC